MCMSRLISCLCIVLGLLAGGIGWRLGGLVGSFLPQTIVATALTAAAIFLLSSKPRASFVAALVVAVVSGVFFLLGTRWVTPLMAWPAAAMATGIVSALSARRMRAKIASVLVAPVLGVVGFVAGMFVAGFLGFAWDEARIVSEVLFAGATGYGLVTILGLRAIGRWIDRETVIGGRAA
jgi:hypothetical protein